MFIAEARLGASAAVAITRICKGGTRANVATPQAKIDNAAGAGQRIVTAGVNRLSDGQRVALGDAPSLLARQP